MNAIKKKMCIKSMGAQQQTSLGVSEKKKNLREETSEE